jgi:hypothetical protein
MRLSPRTSPDARRPDRRNNHLRVAWFRVFLVLLADRLARALALEQRYPFIGN